MNIFGIGPFEIVLILLVAFVFLGPRDMAKTGRTIGRFLRKIVMSPEWRAIRQVAQEIQTTPNRLIREAGIEEMEELRKELGSLNPAKARGQTGARPPLTAEPNSLSAWTQPPPAETILPPAPPADPTAADPDPDTPAPEA